MVCSCPIFPAPLIEEIPKTLLVPFLRRDPIIESNVDFTLFSAETFTSGARNLP